MEINWDYKKSVSRSVQCVFPSLPQKAATARYHWKAERREWIASVVCCDKQFSRYPAIHSNMLYSSKVFMKKIIKHSDLNVLISTWSRTMFVTFFFVFHSIMTTAKFFDPIKHLDSWQDTISKLCLESGQNFSWFDAFVGEKFDDNVLRNSRKYLLFSGATDEDVNIANPGPLAAWLLAWRGHRWTHACATQVYTNGLILVYVSSYIPFMLVTGRCKRLEICITADKGAATKECCEDRSPLHTSTKLPGMPRLTCGFLSSQVKESGLYLNDPRITKTYEILFYQCCLYNVREKTELLR